MKIVVYPVGYRANLAHYGLADGTRRTWRYCLSRARRRDWRAVKNALNGYLAEPEPFPDGLQRCGSGWTRRRALADLRRRMAASPEAGQASEASA